MATKNTTASKASKPDLRQVTIKVNKGKLESMTVRGIQDGKIFAARFPDVALNQVTPLVAHADMQDVRDE